LLAGAFNAANDRGLIKAPAMTMAMKRALEWEGKWLGVFMMAPSFKIGDD
jgi:hypothetical protein